MRFLFAFISLMLSGFRALPDSGHDHGAPAETANGKSYFTVNAASNQFEVVLRYPPLSAGDDALITLFLSDFATNRAIDSARFEITSPEDASIKFTTEQIDKGTYTLHATFPQKKNYQLTAVINAGKQSDLMLMGPIEIGKQLPVATTTKDASVGFSEWWWLVLSFVAGLVLMYGVMKARMNRVQRAMSVIALAVAMSLPLSVQQSVAHEGHGPKKKAAGDLSDDFEVGKETQFLYELYTAIPTGSGFANDLVLNGVIRPAVNGSASITAPQTGFITSLNVRIGQRVTKGQTLAVVQQTLNTTEQVGLATEKASAQAEYETARKEYDRLKSLEDIVAKKELQAAEIRLNEARERKNVYDRLSGELGQSFTVQSPVNGLVDNFNLSLGQQVQQGDALMNVFDNRSLKVEATVFPADLQDISDSARFTVSLTSNPNATVAATLAALGTSIEPLNQSATLVLNLENPSGEFRPGQLVSVAVQTGSTVKQRATVPAEAITDVNGRPAVFVHTEPEQFQIVYLPVANPNSQQVPIGIEVHDYDRLVVNGVYMLKSIFLNR
ncbi:MAG TPA: efflux RND transporter periplasmic adaptor subunit [Chitinophagales bacterium]|nr:efflux RND transporter periplasmic adaptor subunit [Chitinophagales bacterium]